MTKRRAAFTLIEMLVVLAIIGILAALLFPVFARSREAGRQTSCASSLKQIYMAVNLYFQDEKRYPSSLAFLLPPDASLYQSDGAGPATNTNGTGYLKGSSDLLVCPSDDTDSTVPRSSYGDLSNSVSKPTLPSMSSRDGVNAGTPDTTVDPGRYLWDYYGYGTTGLAYVNPVEVTTGLAAATGEDKINTSALVQPANAYNPVTNPVRCSLSNRFAPPQTIITHCIYHRSWTGNKLDYAGDLYDSVSQGNGADGTGARDIVLRLDGTSKLTDVSAFQTAPNKWQEPAF